MKDFRLFPCKVLIKDLGNSKACFVANVKSDRSFLKLFSQYLINNSFNFSYDPFLNYGAMYIHLDGQKDWPRNVGHFSVIGKYEAKKRKVL